MSEKTDPNSLCQYLVSSHYLVTFEFEHSWALLLRNILSQPQLPHVTIPENKEIGSGLYLLQSR